MNTLKRLRTICFLTLFFIQIYPAMATHSHQHINAMGIDVYLAIVPAEMIGGYPKDYPKSVMHRQERQSHGEQFHITVVALEEKTGRRIENINIKARIITDNYNGPDKNMEKMLLRGKMEFGNYFVIPNTGAYRVEIKIHHKGKPDTLTVTFEQAQV